MSGLILLLILAALGGGYLYFPAYRLGLAIALGASYFLWGVVSHRKTLYLNIVLEYFVLAILGMSLLIFLSLRA